MQSNDENVHTYDNGFKPKEVKLNDDYKFYRTSKWARIKSFLTIGTTRIFLFFEKIFAWDFKVIKYQKIKDIQGNMLVANHTHQQDALMIGTTLMRHQTYITMLQSNLGFGIISKYFRAGGAVPIPTEKNLIRKFTNETVYILEKTKANILFYPEAALMPYCDHIRNFMPGAFHYAYMAKRPITPIVITYHKPKGIYKLLRRKKPCIHLNILKPYEIKDLGNKRLTLENAAKEVNEIMNDYFVKNSDYFYPPQK